VIKCEKKEGTLDQLFSAITLGKDDIFAAALAVDMLASKDLYPTNS
jgi:hypothetical protein